MALQNVVESEGLYKIQSWIGAKYKPLIIRGHAFHTQTNKSIFGEKRRACCCNLDLWLDGSLYPVDPCSGKRLKLESSSQLLQFVGDGENGFLGYVKRLETMSRGTLALVSEKEIEITVLRGRIDELIRCSGHDAMNFEMQLTNLKGELVSLQNGTCTMQSEYEVRLQNLNNKINSKQELQSRLSNL